MYTIRAPGPDTEVIFRKIQEETRDIEEKLNDVLSRAFQSLKGIVSFVSTSGLKFITQVSEKLPIFNTSEGTHVLNLFLDSHLPPQAAVLAHEKMKACFSSNS